MSKRYYSYQAIHQIIAQAAERISKVYEPDVIVAIGGGGFIPARILRTYIHKPIYTVGISLYDGDKQRAAGPVKVQWIDEVEKKLRGKRILLVDEVDDTRSTLSFCLKELMTCEPAELGVFVLHYKDKPKSALLPEGIGHYFVGETLADDWICYPWDAQNIQAHHALCPSEGL